MVSSTLDPRSRLKGIETKTLSVLYYIQRWALDPRSRLKGIETLRQGAFLLQKKCLWIRVPV